MKHLKTFESFSINESRIYDYKILPEEALQQLSDYADVNRDKVEVVPDPYVNGTYALQITRDDYKFHLLWNRGAYDEVEFISFPPGSTEDNLAKNFFI